MDLLVIMACALAVLLVVGFFGWVCYDTGYDNGWWARGTGGDGEVSREHPGG